MWISNEKGPLTDVEAFINKFMDRAAQTDDDREKIRSLFRAGYCYHFAHMLQDTFERGRVVWAAPFGHICWQDENDICYDIEGRYCGEALYMIPEEFTEAKIPGNMLRFKHIPGKCYDIKKSEIIELIKAYCKETGETYDIEFERRFIENK